MFVSFIKKMGVKLSLNDPQWGRGSQNNNNQDGKKPNNDGPPDLEEVWRDFTQSINKLLGIKSGGNGSGDGSGQSGGGAGAAGAAIAAVIAGIIFFLWIISGFFIVQEGQTGVITTFGKFSHTTGAGFNFRWPYPFQAHEIVDVSKVRTVEVGYRNNAKSKDLKESLMLTDDENIVDVQFAVQYKLNNAPDWIFNNREAESTIKQVAETSIREIVGKNKMDFVLYEGREKLAYDVAVLMQQILDRYKVGVQVINITMQGVQPPEQVQAAFDDAVKAGQDKERQKNEGQAYANDVIPKARGEASRLLEEAEGYKSRIVATAQGNAERFRQVLAEYQKAPGVTRDRMYLETMQQIFSSTSKVVMDAKANGSMLYLPLDKLIAQGEAGNVSGAKSATSSTTPDPVQSADVRANKDARARDPRDSRDREVR
jgi:modulator of FtsH protease HflK